MIEPEFMPAGLAFLKVHFRRTIAGFHDIGLKTARAGRSVARFKAAMCSMRIRHSMTILSEAERRARR